MSILSYSIKRVVFAIPTLFIISLLSFSLMRYDFTVGPVTIPWWGDQNRLVLLESTRIKNPINPLAGIEANPQISEAAKQQIRSVMGLDQPFHIQYWRWLTHFFSFHPSALINGQWHQFFTPSLGTTFAGEDVLQILITRGKNTLLLNSLVFLFSWTIAIPLGVMAALKWRSAYDRLLTVFTAIGMSLPSFVLALLLALVVVKTGILPFGGLYSNNFSQLSFFEKLLDLLKHLILPAFVLTVGSISSVQRQMRGNLLDVLAEDYIRTARAKGLHEFFVIYKHAVRNAINPLITLLGYELSSLLGGSILIETVLGYPGLGQLTYKAVLETDTNLVMATIMLSSMMLVLGNLLADILLKLTDPRIEV
ncbi:MAG: ABC transporter permease [Cyanobacteria bacterium P01_H01_bin.74]